MLFNPLNAELYPICYLLALLAHHILHVSTIRVKSLTLTLLMSYIYIYIYIYIYDISSLRVKSQLAPQVLDGILKGYTRVVYVLNTRQRIRFPSTRFVMLRFNSTKLAAHKPCTISITCWSRVKSSA